MEKSDTAGKQNQSKKVGGLGNEAARLLIQLKEKLARF